jgi:hypothetical protein
MEQIKTKKSRLEKTLKGICLGLGITLGAYGTVNFYTGATLQDYFGGENKVSVYENGEEKELTIPVYSLLKVGPSKCSKYARLTTESLGNKINRGNAWDLEKNNPSIAYNEAKLSKGDLVLLYNPKSKYQIENRVGSHVVVYLGRDKENNQLYAEQRGIDSKITTLEEFNEEGWTPKRIILSNKK